LNQYSFDKKKLQSQTVIGKGLRKMLMQMIPGVNYTNILRAALATVDL
jgi:hypothetical protein